MKYRLVNQNQPEKIFCMNNQTWFGLLELAEDYGWNPMGTVSLEMYELAGIHTEGPDRSSGDYWSDGNRLVLFEDALNMADALEKAFLDYEPIRLPSLHIFLRDEFENMNRPQPSIGAINLLADFCQIGAFYIEKF